ncbi:unnamed protein product, partial [Symbiodinium sp. CCMP2456]
ERNFLQQYEFLTAVEEEGVSFRIPSNEAMEQFRSERAKAAWERHSAPSVEAMVDLPYFMDQRPTPHPPEGPPCLASKSAPLQRVPHAPGQSAAASGQITTRHKSPSTRARQASRPHAWQREELKEQVQAQALQQFHRVTPVTPHARPAAAKALPPPPPRPTSAPAAPPIMQRTPKYHATPKKRPNSARQEPPAPKTKSVPVQPKSPPLPPTGPPPKGSSLIASVQALARSASEPAGKELPRA